MRKNIGFSLIEVLMASVIFSLLMLGMVSVFISGGKNIVHARERITSAELGKLFLDPLQVYVRYYDWVSGNELSVDVTDHSGGSQVINNRTFSETHDVSAVSGTDLRRVISTITWDEHSS
jgi:prepilin-type N-terminal cleavage/methylation domain-containing protein